MLYSPVVYDNFVILCIIYLDLQLVGVGSVEQVRFLGIKKRINTFVLILFVRMKGLEPPRLSALDPKSSAATNYATSASDICLCCEHGGIRTPNLLGRNEVHYPVMLHVRFS